MTKRYYDDPSPDASEPALGTGWTSDGKPFHSLTGGRQYARTPLSEDYIPEHELPSILDDPNPKCRFCKRKYCECNDE